MRFKLVFTLFALSVFLSGCTEGNTFVKGHIKDDFCGAYINFQYCKCAFHNDYCDAIGMSRGEAKKHVNSEYDKWVESELEKFIEDCEEGNNIVKGKTCIPCAEDEIAQNNKCVALGEEVEDEEEEESDEEEGECKYDSDCDPICEGDMMWKMGCNPRGNICEKTFDTDCSADVESFGELSFPKTCVSGECVRDTDAIEQAKSELVAEKELWSNTVKKINSTRADINVAMLEANKNCINGIADMTNLAIVEFSTRVASVLAGGIPDVAAMTASAAEKAAGLMDEHMQNLASAAVDYVGDGLNRLYNYQQGEPKEEEKKLKPHEYIKLNCDLYEYFKNVTAESDQDLETALNNAREVDQLLQQLP